MTTTLSRVVRLGLQSNSRLCNVTKRTNYPMLILVYNRNDIINYIPNRNYKNFGHKPDKTPLFSKLYYGFLTVLVLVPVVCHKW